jgi:DNA topoisomerase IB
LLLPHHQDENTTEVGSQEKFVDGDRDFVGQEIVVRRPSPEQPTVMVRKKAKESEQVTNALRAVRLAAVYDKAEGRAFSGARLTYSMCSNILSVLSYGVNVRQ